MENLVQLAIQSVNKAKAAFCKFISANDAGKTGGHQSGFYIPKNSISLMFETPGIKGKNKEKFIKIKWQADFETESRFIYYGTGTRNEYRLTRFGRGFPFLSDENVGNLLILCHIDQDFYEGFVFSTDDEIEEFFTAFNLSPNETNRLIEKQITITSEDKLLQCFLNFIQNSKIDFPPTFELALNARTCYNTAYSITEKQIISNPDNSLLNWIEAEYQLFKTFENLRYNTRIQTPFESVEVLIEFANTILNRRKSRAGKSLEHHLSEIFTLSQISYDSQSVTEDNKKPDFLFPNIESYHNSTFPNDKLIFLASKTTCKDRWRQILNEADRIKTKHLFTLQQGISKNQLEEMYNYNVCLVVPKPYITAYPLEYKDKIWTLDTFIKHVHLNQKSLA
jgi:type II restriction enzyme